jgi:hypothetical protein
MEDLPGLARTEVKLAMATLRGWRRDPSESNRLRLKIAAHELDNAFEIMGPDLVAPLRATCECAATRGWRLRMEEAAESARNVLTDWLGPGSGDQVETENQAMHLAMISGRPLLVVLGDDEMDGPYDSTGL